MSRLPLTLLVKDYDYVGPLACGDVTPASIDLQLVRDTANALTRTLDDPSIHAGELSLSRYLIRFFRGDRGFVGIPFFTVRAFLHRSFFVRRGSQFHGLKDLEGKRVGTNEWASTGNTWSRAALREQGVSINRINWWVGPIENPQASVPQDKLPLYAQFCPQPLTLVHMLLEGELDALMCPDPKRFYEADSPVVRLLADYRAAEREYCRRTGIYPGGHIIGVRREVFDRHPWIARSLFVSLDQAKSLWLRKLTEISDMTPWLLTEIEEMRSLIGQDWNPSGVESNRNMIQTLCDELLAQELIAEAVDGDAPFAEFEEIMNS